ncbi:hypothetical protein OH492_10965 [Vibrio chagasii]|nr:hypothetical protein [Vibrio chagasii]
MSLKIATLPGRACSALITALALNAATRGAVHMMRSYGTDVISESDAAPRKAAALNRACAETSGERYARGFLDDAGTAQWRFS